MSNLRQVGALMSEDDLLQDVMSLALLCGWHREHKRPARLENGAWRTAVEGDEGGPDLLLARNGVVLTVELKSQLGKLMPKQKAWQRATNGLVWRPSDWLDGTIERVLK